MWPDPQETADLFLFTEEILNGKLHFFGQWKSCHLDEALHKVWDFKVVQNWWILCIKERTWKHTAEKIRNFPLGISSVNVAKSAGNCGFGYIYWRNP